MTTVFRVLASLVSLGLVCCDALADDGNNTAPLSPRQVVEKALAAGHARKNADVLACLDKSTRDVFGEINENRKAVGRPPLQAFSLFSRRGAEVKKEVVGEGSAEVALQFPKSDSLLVVALQQEDGQWRISFPELAKMRDSSKRELEAKKAAEAKRRH